MRKLPETRRRVLEEIVYVTDTMVDQVPRGCSLGQINFRYPTDIPYGKPLGRHIRRLREQGFIVNMAPLGQTAVYQPTTEGRKQLEWEKDG